MALQTSPAAQDYLKALHAIEWEAAEAGPVSTTAVAERLGVSAASATNMLKRLDSMGLVVQVPYRGTGLTPAGRKIALEVVRHHRLLETYLAEALGVPWDEVHAEAEILEHVLSERLEDRMAALLGDPSWDPHGDPIPSKDGHMPAASRRTLWDGEDGETLAVERVSDGDPEVLRYLAGVGVTPGARVEVVRRGPVAGPLFVRVPDRAGGVEALSRELAEGVWVS
ncbi:MAG: metal-dependent transcriptional regulator [Actinomycetota bacterium]